MQHIGCACGESRSYLALCCSQVVAWCITERGWQYMGWRSSRGSSRVLAAVPLLTFPSCSLLFRLLPPQDP